MNQRDDETRFFGAPQDPGPSSSSAGERPRQYFPGEYDPNAPQQGYQQPQQPGYGYQDPRQDPRYEPQNSDYAASGGSGGTGAATVLGILLGLALLAAIVLFFMWRGAADRANQPPPEPVTETVVTTEEAVTETATVTETAEPDNDPGTGGGLPEGIEIPTEELPSDSDIESFLNDLFSGQGQEQGANAQ